MFVLRSIFVTQKALHDDILRPILGKVNHLPRKFTQIKNF